eukprot:954962-Alexandrium_andersonii.AAC.1
MSRWGWRGSGHRESDARAVCRTIPSLPMMPRSVPDCDQSPLGRPRRLPGSGASMRTAHAEEELREPREPVCKENAVHSPTLP